MSKYIDDRTPEDIKNIQQMAIKAFHDKALEIATLYKETLQQMILSGSFNFDDGDLSGKGNKNRRKYQKRKERMTGSATPLLFTGQYANSIKVFADITPPDEKGRRAERETTDNSPRFYVEIEEYNGVYGYYVDVEDMIHNPPPKMTVEYAWAQYYSRNVFKKGKVQKLLDANVANALKELERRAAKGEDVSKAVVPLRWLKRALEYGSGPISARYHWGYVTDLFREQYGTSSDIWEEVKESIYNNLVLG